MGDKRVRLPEMEGGRKGTEGETEDWWGRVAQNSPPPGVHTLEFMGCRGGSVG